MGKKYSFKVIILRILYFGTDIEDITELIATKNNIPKESPAASKPSVPAIKPTTPAATKPVK